MSSITFIPKPTPIIYRENSFLGPKKTTASFFAPKILKLPYVIQIFVLVPFLAFPLVWRLNTVKSKVKRWSYPFYTYVVFQFIMGIYLNKLSS